MDIAFTCHKCGQQIKIDEADSGLAVDCPTCGSGLSVPDSLSNSNVKLFDLNIERVLENWEVHHAVRELISNALDERFMSRSAATEIFKDDKKNWHIRDYGRGLRIEHFTQNENQEKLAYPSGVIGKFGVGLKDALAVLHRHGIGVLICSSHGTFRVCDSRKHGFNDIVTLHIGYDDVGNQIQGSDFILSGIADSAIDQARLLFLHFAGEQVIEETSYGEILRKQSPQSRIYIMGVLASYEPNFLFSYNITSLTEAMKKRLNRERLNVGRTVYSERVKIILKSSKSKVVHDQVADESYKNASGDQCDEMQWSEISSMSMSLLYERQQAAYAREQELRTKNPALQPAEENRPVAFVTATELQTKPGILDNMRLDRIRVVVVNDAQKEKIEEQIRAGEPAVRTVEAYAKEYNASFQYQFVEPSNLSRTERAVFDLTPQLLALIRVPPERLPVVRISETMRITYDDTEGVWDSEEQAIVIKRSKLGSVTSFAATLLHEAAHAMTGASDATREFESVLTDYLGKVAMFAVGSGLR